MTPGHEGVPLTLSSSEQLPAVLRESRAQGTDMQGGGPFSGPIVSEPDLAGLRWLLRVLPITIQE